MRKLFSLIPRRPDVDVGTFHAHWRDIHGVLALEISSLVRYTQHHAGPVQLPGVPRAVYEGVSEAWFAGSWDSAGAPPHHADESYRAKIREDERHFMDLDRRAYLAVEEHELLDRREGAPDDILTKIMVFVPSGASAERWPLVGVSDGAPVEDLVRHRVNLAVPALDEGGASPFSAIAETWWRTAAIDRDGGETVAAAISGLASPEPTVRTLVVTELPFR